VLNTKLAKLNSNDSSKAGRGEKDGSGNRKKRGETRRNLLVAESAALYNEDVVPAKHHRVGVDRIRIRDYS